MKEELKNKLQDNAMELLEFVDKSKDFVVDQAPIYVQELLTFHMLEKSISIICFGLLFIISSIMMIIIFKDYRKMRGDCASESFMYRTDTAGIGIIFAFCYIFLILLTPLIIYNDVKEIAKAKYAPRVLIIEKLQDFVK